jgi:hypothetical protein
MFMGMRSRLDTKTAETGRSLRRSFALEHRLYARPRSGFFLED